MDMSGFVNGHGGFATDVCALAGILLVHKMIVRRLRGGIGGGRGREEEGREEEKNMPMVTSTRPAVEDSEPYFGMQNIDYHREHDRGEIGPLANAALHRLEDEFIRPADTDEIHPPAPFDGNDDSAVPDEIFNGFAVDGLQDGALVCLASQDGQLVAAGDGDSVVMRPSKGPLTSVEWLDGSVRLPSIPSECTFAFRKHKKKDRFSFVACGGGGRCLKAVKNSPGAHTLGSSNPGRHELWTVQDKKIVSVAFKSTPLVWELIELRASSVGAIREAERAHLSEVRSMRTNIQSAELKIRESERQAREYTHAVQKDYEGLRNRCDVQQIRISDLEEEQRFLHNELQSKAIAAKELDRVVVELAESKRRAVDNVTQEYTTEMATLRKELENTHAEYANHLSRVRQEKEDLKNKADSMLESLKGMYDQKETELHTIEEEKERLTSTLQDIAAKAVLVSPSPQRRRIGGGLRTPERKGNNIEEEQYMSSKMRGLPARPRSLYGDDEAENFMVERTAIGGRRVATLQPFGSGLSNLDF